MPDLDAAIRAKLTGPWTFENDAFEDAHCGGGGVPGLSCEVTGFDEMRSALLAVLDLHPDEPHECPGGEDGYGQITVYDVTCPTVRAVAKALGVEA